MLTYATDNFTGGLNRSSPERLSATESSKLQNLIQTEGGLRSINGRNLYNQTQIIASTPVKSLYPFYKTGHRINNDSATTRNRWTLVRCGQYVWLACEENVVTVGTAAIGATYITVTSGQAKVFPTSGTMLVTRASGDTTPFQLAYTAKDESNDRLTVSALAAAIPASSTVQIVDFRPVLYTSGNTDSCGFESMNGRCYVAADGLYRWDGFYYAVGTVACTGNTTLTGTNTTWGTGSNIVLPGDKVYYGNGAAQPHSWNGPYTVASVGSNTSITLTGNGASTSGGTWDYIIVRMHNAGIEAPGNVATLAAQTLSGSFDGSVLYKYTAALYDVATDTESSATPDPADSCTPDATDTVQIDAYLSGMYVGANTTKIRLYRTEGGASTYKWLADYTIPQGTYSGTWITGIYVDSTADAGLGATLPKSTATYAPRLYSGNLDLTVQTSGTATPAGTYSYVWTLYNSLTDTESNPSAASATLTTTGSQYPRVTLTMTDCDRQADYVRIYRRNHSLTDETYYLVTETAWAAGGTTITYDDNATTDADLGAAVSYDHNDSPDDVWRCEAFNGQLYCWQDDTYPERVWFSTVGDPEHWPRYEYGVNDPIFSDATLGGYVACGNPGEEVTMFKPEAGSFSDSGSTGANALVQTKTRAFQWWGRDWVDHRLDEAWTEGCASGDTAANCGGVLAWLSRNGPVLKSMGAPLPERVYQKLFPTLRYPFWEQVTAGSRTSDYFELSSGVYWREFYVFTWCQSTSTVPNRMAMLHLPTMTYTEIGTTSNPCKAHCLSVWNGPGDNGELYYGDAENGYVWRLFAKTGTFTYWTPSSATGVECIHRTGSILGARSPREIFFEKKAMDWTLVFQKPDTNQTITPKIYIEGEETTAGWNNDGTVTETVSATADGGRYYAHLGESGLRGRSFMLEWSGTTTKALTLEGMVLEYEQKERDET